MGPTWSRDGASGMVPVTGTRPNVGFRPVMPHIADGMRTLPAVSVPSPAKIMPAATATPVPELDPPGQQRGFHGFRGRGKGEWGDGGPIANSDSVSFPVITAPRARSLATTVASGASSQEGSRTRLCAVVGPSAVNMLSFTASGMACSGPRSIPAARSASARRAARSAGSVSRCK